MQGESTGRPSVVARRAVVVDDGRTATGRPRPPRVFERPFSRVGLVAGGLFFAASLTPFLLPRSSADQGAVAGIALAVGHG